MKFEIFQKIVYMRFKISKLQIIKNITSKFMVRIKKLNSTFESLKYIF
jgi:hypothetical protein